jgi:Predicted membrane protein (DUF2306)
MATTTATTRSTHALSHARDALKLAGWGLMILLALLLFLYASRYLRFNPDEYIEPQKTVFMTHLLGITAHVAGAMVATIIGPFQFLPKIITNRYLGLHRWLGRVYLLGVLIGGLGGLYMAFLAQGGFAARLGFVTLAILWVTGASMAYWRIRHRDIQSHRQWMVRTYALTFAAVTLRVWLVIFQVTGVDFAEGYVAVAWLSWVPNLIVVEWIVNRIRPRQGRLAAGAQVLA